MYNITKKINKFFENNNLKKGNFWINGSEGKFFLRVTKRSNGTEIRNTIDISSVEIYEKYQNKGVFKEVLSNIEKIGLESKRDIYIENVFDEHLQKYFSKTSYQKDCREGYENCFWKKHVECVQNNKNLLKHNTCQKNIFM